MKRNVSMISLIILIGILFFIGCNKNKVTDPAPEAEPTITSVKYPEIINIITTVFGPTEAVITWTTDVPTSAQILYGLTTLYNQQTFEIPIDQHKTVDQNRVHLVKLTGLQEDTKYHFVVKSIDAQGYSVMSGDNVFLTSKSSTSLNKISNVQVTAIKANEATISWSTDKPESGWVEYGQDMAYGLSKHFNPDETSITLTGLNSNEKYYFFVYAGNITSSAQTFVTASK